MNLFQCKTVPQVIRALEKLLTLLSGSESKATRAINKLQKGLFLLNEEFDDVFSDYDAGILEDQDTIMFFNGDAIRYQLLLSLPMIGEIDDYKKAIENLLEMFSHFIGNNNGMFLVPMEIDETIKYLEEKIGFSSKITYNTPIPILMWTDYSSDLYYMAYMAQTPEHQITREAIAVYCGHDKKSCAALRYSLLHEFGHLIHTRFTKEADMVPETFHSLGQSMLPCYSDLTPHERTEFFADCFATAMAYDWRAEYRTGSLPLPAEQIEQLKTYFSELISGK
ncbi:hypothetical protein [uncultured Oscillibacter sp.]|uniref:hypothetical protein n=1 Tax=uncultured Oscillibacter sp. TaxID=876091 RepID=UPI00280386A3|nr:hypothetical protein [uncultured Oscillibacter sp.]